MSDTQFATDITDLKTDVAELKTDVKYIRQSIDQLPKITDTLARHDERIKALESAQETKSDHTWALWVALAGSMLTSLWTVTRNWFIHLK